MAEAEGTAPLASARMTALPNPAASTNKRGHPSAMDVLVCLAEAEGFEPSRGFETSTRLAGGRHRPD